MLPDKNNEYLKIISHYNMNSSGDTDPTFKIRIGRGCAGQAFKENSMIVGDRLKGLDRVLDKEDIDKIPKDLKYIACAPIRNPKLNGFEEVFGVLSVDSFDEKDGEDFQKDEFVEKVRRLALRLGMLLFKEKEIRGCYENNRK